jgi:hypothetical protein
MLVLAGGFVGFNIFTSHLKQKVASYQSPLTLEGGEISMKPRIKQLVICAFAAIMLLSGVFATSARAQHRVIRRPPRVIFVRPYNPFWYRRYDPFWDPFYSTRYRVVDPIAYQREQGYRDGHDEGKKDAKKGRPANPTGNKDYIKSNSLAYREAFVQGYNERFREEMAEIREEMSERQR